MKLTNGEMNIYLNSLTDISVKVKGKLAYCVARNIRKISNELIEFERIKNDYICEHGHEENGRYIININTKEYADFLIFIKEYIEIEHDIDIMLVESEEIYKSDLTGDEILKLDFMIKEEE